MRRLKPRKNKITYFVKNLKFNYDKLNDLLYVYKKDSSVYSNVIVGEFHLELNKSGEIIGLEVLNASGILGEYDISKKILENIQRVDIRVVKLNNSLLAILMINGHNQEKSATITMNALESPIIQAMHV